MQIWRMYCTFGIFLDNPSQKSQIARSHTHPRFGECIALLGQPRAMHTQICKYFAASDPRKLRMYCTFGLFLDNPCPELQIARSHTPPRFVECITLYRWWMECDRAILTPHLLRVPPSLAPSLIRSFAQSLIHSANRSPTPSFCRSLGPITPSSKAAANSEQRRAMTTTSNDRATTNNNRTTESTNEHQEPITSND